MKILFADTAHPFLKHSLENAGHECYYDDLLTRETALSIINGFDGVVIRSRFRFDKEMINACTNLRFIARVGAGMENIDSEYATSRGIICLNAPEGNRNAVGEQALGMLLCLLNNVIKADKEVRNGQWVREGNRGTELSGKTIGLIGYGNTGSAFASCLTGFNTRILAYDPYKSNYGNERVEESGMEEIFEQADIVSLHIPLTEETRYLVNNKWLHLFKKDIYLINTARGKCLNTADLVKAIIEGKVLGAALDVIEYESVSFESVGDRPEAFRFLIESDKVILTPHIAGWTFESNLKMAEVLFEKINALV